MIIDTPHLFPAAVDDLEGHSAHILQHIQRGKKPLVEGLDGIRATYFPSDLEGASAWPTRDPTIPNQHNSFTLTSTTTAHEGGTVHPLSTSLQSHKAHPLY